MKFAEDLSGDGYVITAYDATGIAINGKRFEQSLLIATQKLEENWPPGSIAELDSEHIQQISDMQPELIILGTGNKLVFPPVEIYAALIRQNIGIEFMDTGAACRTYNILSGEGRNVVAGIIIG